MKRIPNSKQDIIDSLRTVPANRMSTDRKKLWRFARFSDSPKCQTRIADRLSPEMLERIRRLGKGSRK